jgi:predicted transcriptional regulator
MLEPLFGAANRERVLFFILAREESYPREIADYYKTGLAPIQKQLEKLEQGGVVYSRMAGRTRLYTFNPRYPLLAELQALLEKALTFYPKEERDRLFKDRKRPRRKDKPL